MDNKKVKEMVIDTLWMGSKTDDEYRSLSIQIDNFIENLKNQNSPLNWIPAEAMSDEDVVTIICTFLERSKKQRLMVHNLNTHKGLRFDYSDLLEAGYNAYKKVPWSTCSRKYTKLNDVAVEDISNAAIRVSDLLRPYPDYNLREAIARASEMNDQIASYILDKKEKLNIMGLDIIDSRYLESYITFVETICERVCTVCVLYDNAILDKMAILQTLEKALDQQISAYNTESCNLATSEKSIADCGSVNKAQLEKHLDNQSHIDKIFAYYSLYLKRRAYFDERNNIFDALLAEMHDCPTQFYAPKPAPKNIPGGYSDQELKDYLTEGITIHDYTRKLKDAMRLLESGYYEGRYYIYDVVALKSIFREMSVNKKTYERKAALNMAV